jgi:PAS domain S-box-containing protein
MHTNHPSMNPINRIWLSAKRYWKQLPIERRGSIAIAVPMLCVIGSVITDSLLRQRITEAQIDVSHTNQILIKSQGSLVSFLNAETGVRGYYIGKQKVFLTPYEKALTTLEPTLISLEQLVRDNPPQQQRVRHLRQLAHDRMELLRGTIQRVETNRSSPELVVQRLTQGKKITDQFREVIDQIEAEEYRLLALRTQALKSQQTINANVMLYGMLISLFGTAVTIQLLYQLAAELRERELRLSESRNLIEAIVANIIDAVMVINPQGKIETFNHAAVKIFDYNPAEVVGWPWRKLLAQSGSKMPGQLFDIAKVEAKSDGKIWQIMGQRKNGEWFPIEASINQIVLDNDRLVIIRDITDRQQSAAKLAAKAVELIELNESLKVSNQSLNQSNRDLEQQRAQIETQNLQQLDFIAHLTHDLRTPLIAANLMFKLFKQEAFGSLSLEMQQALAAMSRNNQNLLDLVNTLLEVHHYESGHKTLTLTHCNMWEIIQAVVEELQPLAQHKSIALTPIKDATDWDSITILGDYQEIRRMITNLVGNSLKFTEVGGVELRLGFRPAHLDARLDVNGWVTIAVKDTGLGMSASEQQVAFERFRTGQHRQAGSGLGLHLVQRIVTMHSGTIDVTSKTGQGSLFQVCLPACQ